MSGTRKGMLLPLSFTVTPTSPSLLPVFTPFGVVITCLVPLSLSGVGSDGEWSTTYEVVRPGNVTYGELWRVHRGVPPIRIEG